MHWKAVRTGRKLDLCLAGFVVVVAVGSDSAKGGRFSAGGSFWSGGANAKVIKYETGYDVSVQVTVKLRPQSQ
jgi:hypothetical protein